MGIPEYPSAAGYLRHLNGRPAPAPCCSAPVGICGAPRERRGGHVARTPPHRRFRRRVRIPAYPM